MWIKVATNFCTTMHCNSLHVAKEKMYLRHILLFFADKTPKPAVTHLQFIHNDSLHVINLIKMGQERCDLDTDTMIPISRQII